MSPSTGIEYSDAFSPEFARLQISGFPELRLQVDIRCQRVSLAFIAAVVRAGP
jgi:hypothetical protein